MECKITTITRYRTSDGIEHDTIEAALNHCSKSTYRMWAYAEDGLEETNNFGRCAFIHLPTLESVGSFVKESAKAGYTREGIRGPGWYMWNPSYRGYVHIPMAFCSLLTK